MDWDQAVLSKSMEAPRDYSLTLQDGLALKGFIVTAGGPEELVQRQGTQSPQNVYGTCNAEPSSGCTRKGSCMQLQVP